MFFLRILVYENNFWFLNYSVLVSPILQSPKPKLNRRVSFLFIPPTTHPPGKVKIFLWLSYIFLPRPSSVRRAVVNTWQFSFFFIFSHLMVGEVSLTKLRPGWRHRVYTRTVKWYCMPKAELHAKTPFHARKEVPVCNFIYTKTWISHRRRGLGKVKEKKKKTFLGVF